MKQSISSCDSYGSAGQSAMQFVKPDLYQLSGDGIDISYLPVSVGGQPLFTYHDTQRPFNICGDQIRRVELPDFGKMISVTFVVTVDSWSTTFSILMPHVNLGDKRGVSEFIQIKCITTVHRLSPISVLNQGQGELYRVTPLNGQPHLSSFRCKLPEQDKLDAQGLHKQRRY